MYACRCTWVRKHPRAHARPVCARVEYPLSRYRQSRELQGALARRAAGVFSRSFWLRNSTDAFHRALDWDDLAKSLVGVRLPSTRRLPAKTDGLPRDFSSRLQMRVRAITARAREQSLRVRASNRYACVSSIFRCLLCRPSLSKGTELHSCEVTARVADAGSIVPPSLQVYSAMHVNCYAEETQLFVR